MEKKTLSIIKCIPALAIAAMIGVLAVVSLNDISEKANTEGLSLMERAVKRSIITCYSEEGSYPESIDYLVESYGLHISEEYVVYYDMFATNVMPNIQVVRK